MVDRAKLRALADAATPGPWNRDADGVSVYIDVRFAICDASGADANFIAAARTAVPALLDEIERVERERDDALAQVAGLIRLAKDRWIDE